jgi:hypothetical protein
VAILSLGEEAGESAMRSGESEGREEERKAEARQQERGADRRALQVRLWVALVPAVMLAVCGNSSAARARAGSMEYDVKAAFLFHFAQFVEWPAEAFKEPQAPFTYCTIGEDPFHGALERTLSGKTIGQRALRVEHLSGTAQAGECQILFIGGPADKKHIAETLASVSELPILTVGEEEQFAADGGAIGFCMEDNKIRFEINLKAAGKARLKISAKLLALAKTVLGAPKGI